MNTYKLVISYDGHDYYGWQKQPNVITIQGELEKTILRIFNLKEIQTVASGRTDAGVHASSQYIRLQMQRDIAPSALLKALNDQLPEAIIIKSAERVKQEFNPVFDAKNKTYKYYFAVGDTALSPFESRYVTAHRKPLDLEKLEDFCSFLVGEKDFQNYFCTGTPYKSTIRTIFSSKITLLDKGSEFSSNTHSYYCFEITGSGFLKQMVRLVVSTMWRYASNEICRKDILDSFEGPLETKLAPVAPPNGLFLSSVSY